MPSDRFKASAEEQIDKEAAEWFIKRDRGLNDEESKAYEGWLRGDGNRRARIDRHEKTWLRFCPIEEFDDESMDDVERVEEVASTNRFRELVRPLASLAAVLLFGLLVVGVVKLLDSGEGVEYEGRFVVTAYETRILMDGSILEMKEGARIKVRLTDMSRSVWLHDGEAHFYVAKDPKRPFFVYAGDTEVKAVGTAFNVRRDHDSVQVVVTEGRINFSKTAQGTKRDAQPKVFSQSMDAGQVTTVSFDRLVETPEVETFTYDQISELLPWRPETLEFRSAPLGDVVMAFNKRNDIQIILGDEELETMPIEATFRSDNVLAFARLLEMTFELQAERLSQNEIVLRQPQ